ncbi:hypothetical protein EON65_28030, partial [archaeon]
MCKHLHIQLHTHASLPLQDPRSERTTLIGIGFREKDGAMDLRGALNEYVRYIDRLHRANKRAGSVGSLGSSSGEEGDEVSMRIG